MGSSIQSVILLCSALIFITGLIVVAAQKLKIAYPIFLVIAGLMIGFIPSFPSIHLEPEIIFIVILPPVLFEAAFSTSLKSLLKWRRIIAVMAFGYVLFTATAVAFISHWLIPGFSLSEGFLLGAIISPPDAAAATSVLKFTKLAKTTVSVLEGESLLNDATSLTLFRFALAAIATTNHFSFPAAMGSFVLVVISGVTIGALFGAFSYAIYKWLPTNPNLDIAFSIVFPYAMYLTAEALHSSGVLAVVTGGLILAYQAHFVFSHSSRLKGSAIWSSVVFILNSVVFLLIGLQLPEIVHSLHTVPLHNAIRYALIITLVIVAVRIFSGLLTSVFTTFISRYIKVNYNRPGWRNPLLAGWVGMRGVVSLASASAVPLLLPNGQQFPFRDLILFITFIVILLTLVVQGLTLPWLIKLVKPEFLTDRKSDRRQTFEIQLALYTKANESFESKFKNDVQDNVLLSYRAQYVKDKLGLLQEATDHESRSRATKMLDHYKVILNQVTQDQRETLHTFRKIDDYDDNVIGFIENKLDLEQQQIADQEDQIS